MGRTTERMEMTDVNRILAEKVMGWHKGQIRNHPSNLWWWMNDKEQTEIPVINWQPDQNIEQALMCAEKWCEDNENDMRIHYDTKMKYWWVSVAKSIAFTNKVLEQAICSALLEAVKGEKE